MTSLTAKEIEALKGVVNSDFRDGCHPVERQVWTWSANPFGSKRTFSGVVASLSKKGYVISTDEGEDSCIWLTVAGWDALKASEPEFALPVEENLTHDR